MNYPPKKYINTWVSFYNFLVFLFLQFQFHSIVYCFPACAIFCLYSIVTIHVAIEPCIIIDIYYILQQTHCFLFGFHNNISTSNLINSLHIPSITTSSTHLLQSNIPDFYKFLPPHPPISLTENLSCNQKKEKKN